MSLTSSAFSVTTSAQKIVEAGETPMSCQIANPTGNPEVFVGGSNVTTANGMPIPAGGTPWTADLFGSDDDVYIIGASACTVRVLQVT